MSTIGTILLRPYQETCVSQVLEKWNQFHRLLAVLPTGAGKTIIFSSIAAKVTGKVLVLAHREELLQQAIDKMVRSTGIKASLERADSHADLDAKVIVASVQTMVRRFASFQPDHFDYIIIDEAHHVAADTYLRILDWFAPAKVLGVTATPDRSDKRELGRHFDDIAFEITLGELIQQGYLSKIRARVCDVEVDLSKTAIRAGDFAGDQVDDAIQPVLGNIAEQIKQYGGKKTLVFLPVISTSKRFADTLSRSGLNARHVDGLTDNRKEIISWFASEKEAVLCNAMLLTEGFDEPSIDTIVCLRPTRSRALYTQMVGRGTRLYPGKEHLTILDFLWLTGRHRLVRPTSLFSEGEVAEIADKRTQETGEYDVEQASIEATAERERNLAEQLKAKKKFSGKFIDPVEFAVSIHSAALQDWEPTMAWHSDVPSEKQKQLLAKFGFNVSEIKTKGMASVILDAVMERTKLRLATPKQVRFLMRMGHHNAGRYTFKQASEILSKICKRKS